MDAPAQPLPEAQPVKQPETVVTPPAPRHGLSHTVMILLIALVVAILAVVSYFFIYPLYMKAQHPTVVGPVENIRVGNIGEYSIFNLIAQNNGYFTKNGLNATITEYSAGPQAMTGLLAGKEDVTIAGDFVGVSNFFTHTNLRILAEVSKQKVFSVIVRKDLGITSPADLKGKKIGVTLQGGGEFFLGRFLTLNNLLPTDVTLVNLTTTQMTSEIESGTIDAVIIFEPHVYEIQQAMGSKVAVWPAQGEENTSAYVYATSSYISSHPSLVQKYIQALEDAQNYLQTNPTGAQAILAKDMHYTPSYVTYLWPKIRFNLVLDQEMLLDMEDEGRWEISNKLTTQTQLPNYLNYIYFNTLNTIDPTAITVIR